MESHFRNPRRKFLSQPDGLHARLEWLVSFGKWSRARLLAVAAIGVLIVLFAAFVLLRARSVPEVPQVAFSEVLSDLNHGLVREVVVSGDALEVKLASGRVERTMTPANYVTANPTFVSELRSRHVRFDIRSVSEQTAYGYGALALSLAFIGLLGFTLYRVTTGRIPTLESKAREADPGVSTVTF